MEKNLVYPQEKRLGGDSFVAALDWFRGVAILFVVLSHLPLDPLMLTYPGTLLALVIKNGTFFFVFISGYLFWHLISKYEYIPYIVKKVKFVVTPYIFVLGSVLLIYAALSLYFGQVSSEVVSLSDPLSENGLLWHILVGGAMIDALWYVPMISIMFLCAPLIVHISRSRFFLIYFLFFMTISITSFRPERLTVPVYMFIHYLGVYLFGILLKRNQEALRDRAFSITIIGGLLWVCSLIVNAENLDPGFWSFFYGDGPFAPNYFQISKAFATFFVLGLLFLVEDSGRSLDFLTLLAKYSFGIFFVHGPIIWSMKFASLKFFGTPLITTVLDYFIVAFVVVLLSLLICMLVVRLSGKRSRFLIGC